MSSKTVRNSEKTGKKSYTECFIDKMTQIYVVGEIRNSNESTYVCSINKN